MELRRFSGIDSVTQFSLPPIFRSLYLHQDYLAISNSELDYDQNIHLYQW